jgi:membrane-associated phospholipid phosphatase
VWWFCLVFLLAGILGSARMYLRQHTLAQVVGGFGIGFVCAVLGIVLY